VPLLGIAGAAIARWRHRGYYVALMVVGTALAVGAYPWDKNPLFGHLVQEFQGSDAGLAMRSLPRAVPLVVLGTAVLFGSGVASVARRWPRVRQPSAVAAVIVAILALPPLWLGQFVPDNLRRPEEVPGYWRDAADYLDRQDDGTRVLVLPGSDFAAYRWGSTVDPILPGLMDRPSVQRETVPNGSPVSAHLLDAFDLTLQENTADPDAVAPIARLMRAGDVLVVGDWQYERNSTPEPGRFWDFISAATGFRPPEVFGQGGPGTDDPPDLAVMPVEDAPAIVGTHATDQPLLVAGDAAGLVDAAGAGLIDGTELIRYSASLSDEEIAAAVDDGAVLLLTDTNRKRGERWNTLRHNRGYTETVDGGPLATDLGDNRLPVFPGAGIDSETVAVRNGGISAEATSYGNPITYVPEERPMMAVDGDWDTTWKTGAYSDVRGERLELTLDEPVTTDRLRLGQPSDDTVTRYVQRARLRFDDGDPIDIDLAEKSFGHPGQLVTFPERTFSTLSIEVLADSAGAVPRYSGLGGVGFSEVEIGDVPNPPADARETVRLPSDLLDAAGAGSADNPLAVVLTRLRQDPTDPARVDEEPDLRRSFELPTDRSFGLSGTARLSATADAEVIDTLLSRPHDGSQSIVRTGQVPRGTVVPTSWDVFDGDPATAWTTGDTDPRDQWVEVVLPAPVTIDELPVTFVDDDESSLPTRVAVAVDGQTVAQVDIPAGSNPHVNLDIPRVTGSRFKIKIDDIEVADDSFDADAVGIAEVDLPGSHVGDLPERLDSGCRDDLLNVDGVPVPIRVSGTMADALAARPLQVVPCGSNRLALLGGRRHLETARGDATGIDLDQLILRSDPGGEASGDDGVLVHDRPAGPDIEVVEESDSRVRVHVDGATAGEPFWVVLGQSYNDGWRASLAGSAGTASGPQLVDGFANGWLVTPAKGSFDMTLDFAPQRQVSVALWISLIAALFCVGLAVRPTRRSIVAASAAPEPFSARVFRFEGTAPSRPVAVGVGVAMGVVGWFLAGGLVGLVVGVVAGACARRPSWRRVALVGSAAALALAAAYVVYLQLVHNPQPSLDWPFEMRKGHLLGWLAVLLLAVDVVLNRLWRRRDD
jgi:arabinofuranan 3-O-arabinosyltransferase